MDTDQDLSLYRAITGRSIHFVHQGVSDQSLVERGIFCQNFSYAQTNQAPTDKPYDRRVSGLPVFLNFDEAEYWLKGKTYELEPAIVEVKVSLELLFGEKRRVKLVRNGCDSKYDYEPTEEEIQKHISGIKRIDGEAFVQSVNGSDLTRLLRENERIYRPAQMIERRLIPKRGYRQLILN